MWVISGAMTQCLFLILCENHLRTIGNFHKRKVHFYTVLEIINQTPVIVSKEITVQPLKYTWGGIGIFFLS